MVHLIGWNPNSPSHPPALIAERHDCAAIASKLWKPRVAESKLGPHVYSLSSVTQSLFELAEVSPHWISRSQYCSANWLQ